MADEPLTQLILVIDAGLGTDNDELSDLTLRLRQEINELEVDAVEDVIVPVSLEGAKGGAALALNAVEVQTRPGLFDALVALIRDWVARGVDRRVEITFQQADQPVVVKALASDLPVVLKAWAEYEVLRPPLRTAPITAETAGAKGGESYQVARSGGTDIEAERVDISGDVVGRDKIMRAGGHIIIAKEGATVIVGQATKVGQADRPLGEEASPLPDV